MKKTVLLILAMYIITFFIPYSGEKLLNKKTETPTDHITLYDTKTKKTTTVPFDEYLYYTLASEMPASFHKEALKAQCICIRTYAKNKQKTKSHPDGADLCTDINHCQAYTTDDALKDKWKENYNYYKDKLQSAVTETKNMIITYNNEPIDAIYHSSNNGYTENSEDVWQKKLPYLRSVKSPDENSPHCNYTYHIKAKELYSLIKEKYPDAKMNKGIGKITYTTGGNIKTINLYSVEIKGHELRKLLDLKSASFDITENNDTVEITTHGYGHGVGLSQYGANQMAHNGNTFREIITHYYTGTQISEIE